MGGEVCPQNPPMFNEVNNNKSAMTDIKCDIKSSRPILLTTFQFDLYRKKMRRT